jgi:hypothetical protein
MHVKEEDDQDHDQGGIQIPRLEAMIMTGSPLS